MQAVGIDTGKVYAVADNRVDLQRKLNEKYKDDGLCQSIYPETIKITECDINKITKNMSPMEEIVLLTADKNWMESERAEAIENRLKELREKIDTDKMKENRMSNRRGHATTVYQREEKREYPSLAKCADAEQLPVTTLKYWIDKGTPDKKGRLFFKEEFK